MDETDDDERERAIARGLERPDRGWGPRPGSGAFIEAILEEELEAALGRARYQRTDEGPRGWRNGHRERQGDRPVRA